MRLSNVPKLDISNFTQISCLQLLMVRPFIFLIEGIIRKTKREKKIPTRLTCYIYLTKIR